MNITRSTFSITAKLANLGFVKFVLRSFIFVGATKLEHNNNSILIRSAVFTCALLFFGLTPHAAHAQAVWNATDWTLYDTITIDATQVDDDLTDFPVYVDLSDLSAQFWSTTPTGASTVGTDIRITTSSSSPTELPRELVFASSTAQTGELHFKADSISSTTDTIFRIYYNGTTTGDYATSSTYGAQNVWSNEYVYVNHNGGGESDSTGNIVAGTANGGVINGGVSGQVGAATDFDGANDYIDYGDNNELDFNTESFTLTSWFKSDVWEDTFPVVYNGAALASEAGYLLRQVSTDTVQFLVGDGVSRSYRNVAGVTTGDWHYLSGSVNRDTSELSLLVDDTVATTSISFGGIGNSYPFQIGSQDNIRHVNGKIDEIRLASTTRSTAWISAEYTNQSTTTDFYKVNEPTVSSVVNQTFALGAATTTISLITVTDSGAPQITTTNDIRIAIATSSVDMRFDTSDTTAVLGGTASGNVSATVSYSGDGSVLILDVTTNFTGGDTLTIDGLSYSQFNALNNATSALQLHLDGVVDATPNATDDKTVEIYDPTIATWDGGGGNSNWETAANWSHDVLPGTEQNVIIDTAVTVNINGTTTINSLSLGSSTATVASVLSFNYNAHSNGALVVNGDVVVYGGANITHTANASTQAYTIDMTVGGQFTLNSGATVNLDSRGYVGRYRAAGYGPGAGGYTGSAGGGSGASYGGDGGNGESAANGASAYGSTTYPVQLGSSGGAGYSPYGGDGGGLIVLDVTGTTTINGTITADGATAGGGTYAGGGGAGGGVNITTGVLTGTGSIGVIGGNGGSAGNSGGGGGGGRIALVYGTGTSSSLTLQAYGGTAPADGQYAAAGTIFTKSASQSYGNLLVDNGGRTSGVYSSAQNDAITPITGLPIFDALVVDNGALVEITSSPASDYDIQSVTIDQSTLTFGNGATATATQLTFINSGVLNVAVGTTFAFGTVTGWGNSSTIVERGVINFPDNSVTVPSGGFYYADVPRSFTDVTVSGTLSHSQNVSAKTYYIDLDITGDFTLNSGGFINLDARGYEGRYRAAGYGLSAGGYTGSSGGGAGGAYGGDGGDGESAVGKGGTAYGSTTYPAQLGSAGGAGYSPYGGDGGGLVILDVAGTATINGTITADGATAGGGTYAGGGGAGGGVNITTGTLTGTGVIGVNGGNGGSAGRAGGGGGGGRIAVVYGTGSDSGLTIQARGGTAPADGRHGAAGTVFTKSGAQSYGSLSVDNNGVNAVTSNTPLAVGLASLRLNDVAIKNAAIVTTPNSLTLDGSYTNNGTISHAGTLAITGNYTNNGTITHSGVFTLEGNYTNNGTITHNGTTTFDGTTQQTATGTMTGASAFEHVEILNTSGNGTTTFGVVFGNDVTTSGNMMMIASTSAQFTAGATSTLQNVDWRGTATSPVYVKSSDAGTQWYLDIPGSQTYVQYVDVQDSDATSTTGGIVGRHSVDSGNNTNWTFDNSNYDLQISSAANQTFFIDDATTTISTITLTDDTGEAEITAANDIRIAIATSSVAMLFDTTDTTAVLGGTASGLVNSTVSYAGGGSVLILDVTSDFAIGDTLSIAGLSYSQFSATNTATSALQLYLGGSVGASANAIDDKTVNITVPGVAGSSTISNHDATQVNDAFDFQNKTNEALFAFKLTPNSGTSTVTNIVFDLTGLKKVVDTDFSNLRLYRDLDNDALYDATDAQVGGAGTMTIADTDGNITFATSFLATTSQNYVLIADWNAPDNGAFMTLHLNAEDITMTDDNGAVTVDGTVSTIQHSRNNRGGGGGGVSTAGASGAGIITGGTNAGGQELGGLPNFNPPTSTGDPHTQWTGGANAYASDGTYASETTSSERQSYGTLGYTIPGTSQIDGIELKLEASASVGTGTIEVALSWDGGTTVTAVKATAELTGTDTIYILGGSSDTWGRTWSPSDFSDANFRIRLIGQPSAGGAVQVDAILVRVYSSTGGGGGGGGSSEI